MSKDDSKQPEVVMADGVMFIDAEGDRDVCGKHQQHLHHFGEMCDNCYRDWSAGYTRRWNAK